MTSGEHHPLHSQWSLREGGRGGRTLQIPWSTSGQQARLVIQPGLCAQEGTKSVVLPQEAGLFQCLLEAPLHVLSVRCVQCSFLCCCFLGGQHKEKGHQEAGQNRPESWSCDQLEPGVRDDDGDGVPAHTCEIGWRLKGSMTLPHVGTEGRASASWVAGQLLVSYFVERFHLQCMHARHWFRCLLCGSKSGEESQGVGSGCVGFVNHR